MSFPYLQGTYFLFWSYEYLFLSSVDTKKNFREKKYLNFPYFLSSIAALFFDSKFILIWL